MDTFVENAQLAADTITSISPATGRVLGEVPIATPDDIHRAMQAARLAQEAWHQQGLKARLAHMRQLRAVFYRNADQLIDTIIAEQGRPRFEAMGEYVVMMELLRYYLRIARHTLKPRRTFVRLIPTRIHRIEYRPYGVVLVITPWNFPLVLSIAPILAALIGGNAVIYKPSEYATQMGNLLTQLIREAGIPQDVFQVVQGYGDVGSALIHEKPDKISFTGSVATGQKVASMAGELLIPVSLELGGKDAAIVLEDADLDRAAHGIAWAGMINAGQVCASVERVYVMRRVADQLVSKMAHVLNSAVRLGPGEAQTTTMGAITTEAQIKIINRQVQEAVDQGAKVILGGHTAEDRAGRFYLPTLITDVKPEMQIVANETFGPVIVVIPVDSHDEALRLANQTNYGLTGSVWTRNRAEGLSLARQMKVGNAAVNDHMMSSSAPNLPWGGIKESGYGRTRGVEGLLEMVVPQSLSVERFVPLPREFFWYPYTPLKLSLLRRALHIVYGPTIKDKLRGLMR